MKQKPCFITRTNLTTHRVIKENLSRSPLFTGKIKSTGVRYCPSIEDKVVRFPSRDSHTVFLEPEGLDTDEYYPNGISTSLPYDVQEKMVHSIQGLENARLLKAGYGIEYDIVDPTELKPTLETKKIERLFLAGQINGTTGYEEAASLGLIAGINAGLLLRKKSPLILERSQSYIGVLIDDLITKGTNEPYRMFTSRVEYRLTVREDNAAVRLAKIGHTIGLISSERLNRVKETKEQIHNLTKKINLLKLSSILKRPGVSFDDIAKMADWQEKFTYFVKTNVEVNIKYEGYIKRELLRINKFKKIERINIPRDFDYSSISGLSSEIKEKLSALRPHSLGQAARISGITPAAISLLLVKLHTADRW